MMRSLYALNRDEFRSWERCIDRFGVKGLRTARTQFYLNSDPPLREKKSRRRELGIVGIAEALRQVSRLSNERRHPASAAHCKRAAKFHYRLK
jgi:hypothetical protein